MFKGDRLDRRDRRDLIGHPILLDRWEEVPPVTVLPWPPSGLPEVAEPPRAPESAPAADPEAARRHRRGRARLQPVRRHGMRDIWYDNGRRWHCRH